jgi:hypothetical protein
VAAPFEFFNNFSASLPEQTIKSQEPHFASDNYKSFRLSLAIIYVWANVCGRGVIYLPTWSRKLLCQAYSSLSCQQHYHDCVSEYTTECYMLISRLCITIRRRFANCLRCNQCNNRDLCNKWDIDVIVAQVSQRGRV